MHATQPVRLLGASVILSLVLAPATSAQGDLVLSEQKISSLSGGLGVGLSDSDYFGCSCASIGDLDGNGIGDLLVGAYRDDDGGLGRGAVYTLFLDIDGTVISKQKISDTAGGFTGILGNSDYFGWSVALMDDMDGDGVQDVAVGAPWDDDGGG